MKSITKFIDDLSNWYVRRSRRRFWRSENNTDKKAAYSALYQVLLDLIKVMSPIIPFVSDKIYQNLVVRNNNQKRIIIGKSGKMLKNIIDESIGEFNAFEDWK